MKQALLSSLLALTVVGSAVARLGETEKEIEARFGEVKPSGLQRQPGAQTFKYFMNGFEIQVVFDQGKSIWEIFHKKDGSGAFAESDIKNLLDGYKEPKEPKNPKAPNKLNEPTEPKRTWRFDRRENRWESPESPSTSPIEWKGMMTSSASRTSQPVKLSTELRLAARGCNKPLHERDVQQQRRR